MLRTDGRSGPITKPAFAKATQVKTMLEVKVTGKWYTTSRYPKMHSRDFFAILGRGPRAFQIGKISVVNP